MLGNVRPPPADSISQGDHTDSHRATDPKCDDWAFSPRCDRVPPYADVRMSPLGYQPLVRDGLLKKPGNEGVG